MDKRYSWTKKELGILENNYQLRNRNDILLEIPLHSWTGIRNKARIMGLSRKNWIGHYKHKSNPKFGEWLKKRWQDSTFKKEMLKKQKKGGWGYRRGDKHPLWKGGRRSCGVK